ncbi:protein MAINTENANCE OF MERISTEMS-like [Medicago truncatula]|uniref:protein MAINTENANCE OF MERISTEMS-like n=1 Tax=Medicago truncatula TaxID=3880 RepID=UPI001966EF6B|nr:protein MAINTENANCE OF MERISTEMS-like [Medicago truncatula]
MPEQQHIPDEDDIAVAAAPAVLPLEPPFHRGPENISLLHSYANHVALPLWYNSDNVRKTRVVRLINHGAKILSLGRPNNNNRWFLDALRESGLHDLVYLGYAIVSHALLMTLCERWHPETGTFHMPLGEMIVTLDDVACLMHVQIEGRMLSHPKKMSKHERATLMVRHLGVSEREAEKIYDTEYDGYISYPKLKELYTRHFGRANIFADTKDPEEMEELERVRNFCVRSNKHIELVYLTTMEGGLAGMRNYSWGGMALAYLYGELVDACLPGDRALGGSVTLLTA